MKTAISIPTSLYEKGERLAKRLKLNRSELYARALEELVYRHEPGEITKRLNAVYEEADKARGLDPVLAAQARRSLKKVVW